VNHHLDWEKVFCMIEPLLSDLSERAMRYAVHSVEHHLNSSNLPLHYLYLQEFSADQPTVTR
jgi:hypothetical protein